MNGIAQLRNILAIKLKRDGFIFDHTSLDDDVIIGTIVLDDLTIKCTVLRNHLDNEITCLPQNYIFLSRNGWPIEKSDEHQIEISQLILSSTVTIQRQFELPRLGVKWNEGECLGFIFISYNSSLVVARETIISELGDKFLNSDTNFEFLERNGWPVAPMQEKDLTIWDITDDNSCNISKSTAKRRSFGHDIKVKKKSMKLPVRKKFKVSTATESKPSTSILISYVHAEASKHARDLKRELINMGIDSVFLDVDDIPAGQDWQDVINTTLNNCTAFVALVTPRYGETRWTNREAKLADDKEKLIIPVSFLDKWPPDQLAIQFLSLQYIPWILEDDFLSGSDYLASVDISNWDQRCVHRVAKEIKKLCNETDISTPDSASLLETAQSTEHSNRYLSHSKASFYQPNAKKCLIVISAHFEQKLFVDKLVQILEENYKVWSSINANASNGDVFSGNDDSLPSESSPCLEAFSQAKVACNYTNSFETDSGSKIDSKEFSCSWTESAGNENFQCEKSEFKKMVKNASLVILINSEEYNTSRACKQQAFYCEQRIEVIVIKYGSFETGIILSHLYPEQDMLEISEEEIDKFHKQSECNEFISILKKEITKSLESSKRRKTYMDQIQDKVALLKQEIATEFCVYVIGGTNCISKNAEAFCMSLGSELAKIRSLNLVTEGFFGAGEIVGKNFCEEREILSKGKPLCTYHVVPFRDNMVTKRARQKDDGSFEKIPYGRTLFYGDSIIERDDIVSSAFKLCILIEGGERSASLAEKFLWNDCTVVPIIFNNRAISSKYCLASCIKKVPFGVNFKDWEKLDHYDSIEELAKTVKKIVSDLLKSKMKSLEIKP